MTKTNIPTEEFRGPVAVAQRQQRVACGAGERSSKPPSPSREQSRGGSNGRNVFVCYLPVFRSDKKGGLWTTKLELAKFLQWELAWGR